MRIAFPLLLIGLTLLGSLSPLCTFAALWQVKEWRWDRLREHLTREGIGNQLFGHIRPAVLALYGLSALLFAQSLWLAVPATLTVFVLLTGLQFGMHKQPMPLWTQKSQSLAVGALVITGIAAIACTFGKAWIFLPFLPVFQPFALMLAWLVLRPLDYSLKSRILHEAKTIRERFPRLTVIGITGSVGKTTTKELLGHVLQPLDPLITPAHVNTELGVAQWMIRELPSYAAEHPDGGVLVVEMGAYSKGEIALMSTYVQQTIGIVTAVGTQHLALFGSQEALLQAKSELITALPANGRAFLNGDNALCLSIKDRSPCAVTIVGTTDTADVRATEVKQTQTGLSFRVNTMQYTVPLHGTHNVTNILLAIAVAKNMGMTQEVIAERLQSVTPPARTFFVREEQGVRILDDTYNGSASSFTAAFAWAASQAGSPKVLLTSGLIELGKAQRRTEKELGALATPIFDRVIFTQEKSIGAFGRGYGKTLETLGRSTAPVPAGSLLVCAGRMPPSSIQRLLPHD